MKSLLLITLLAVAIPVSAQSWQIGGNPYSPDSTANPYSAARNPYNPQGLVSPYGEYQNPYSTTGRVNPYGGGLRVTPDISNDLDAFRVLGR